MFQSIDDTFKQSGLSERLKNNLKKTTSHKDLKQNFYIEALCKKWTPMPIKLARDKNLKCEVKNFYVILFQLCGLGCNYYQEKSLAKIMGVSERTVRRYVAKLIKAGYLKTKPSKGNNSKFEYITKRSKLFVAIPNLYAFNLSIHKRAKYLWWILQDLGDCDGNSFYSQPKLTKLCGWKQLSTLRKYRNELIKAKMLLYEHGSHSRGKEYYVLWPPGMTNPKRRSIIKKSKAIDKPFKDYPQHRTQNH